MMVQLPTSDYFIFIIYKNIDWNVFDEVIDGRWIRICFLWLIVTHATRELIFRQVSVKSAVCNSCFEG